MHNLSGVLSVRGVHKMRNERIKVVLWEERHKLEDKRHCIKMVWHRVK